VVLFFFFILFPTIFWGCVIKKVRKNIAVEVVLVIVGGGGGGGGLPNRYQKRYDLSHHLLPHCQNNLYMGDRGLDPATPIALPA